MLLRSSPLSCSKTAWMALGSTLAKSAACSSAGSSTAALVSCLVSTSSRLLAPAGASMLPDAVFGVGILLLLLFVFVCCGQIKTRMNKTPKSFVCKLLRGSVGSVCVPFAGPSCCAYVGSWPLVSTAHRTHSQHVTLSPTLVWYHHR